MHEVTCLQVAVAALGAVVKRQGQEHLFRCPGHDDQRPSLQVNERKDTWLCGPCGKGGTAWQLAAFLTGISESDKAGIIAWFRERGLLAERVQQPQRRIVATYPYRDEQGRVLFETVRFDPKGFAYRHMNGDANWTWNLQNCRLVPYRLPELLAADVAWVCEGEKNCDDLAAWGLAATTNPMGAGKWRAEWSDLFAFRDVLILPDNDEPGRKHAQQVAAALLGSAASVKIVTLPGLAPKGDVSDWKAAGGTKAQLESIGAATDALTSVAAIPGPYRDLAEVPGLAAIPNVPVTWLVEKFLPADGLTILAGMKGAYKSWLALDLASRIAAGRMFAGRLTTVRPVLYLDRENPAAVIRIRKDVLGTGDPAGLHYWGQWDAERPCDIGDIRLLEFCRAKKPMVVFDSLVRWNRGDENSADQMAKVTEQLRALVAIGASVVVVAHRSDKPGSPDYRGSSELLAGCDMAWRIERREQDRRTVDLRCLKNRFGEEEDMAVRLESGGFINATGAAHTTALDAIMAAGRLS